MSTKRFGFRISDFGFKQRGFTLIELLITVAIIAILISIGSASFLRAQRQGRDAQRKSDLGQVASALEQYYADWNFYPEDNSGVIMCGAPIVARNWGVDRFDCDTVSGLKIYLSNTLPQDPNGSPTYFYDAQSSSGGSCLEPDCQRFIIGTNL